MELAQLLITPGTLLTAFIFFWKQAKASSDELKRELKEDLKQAKAGRNELRQDLKSDIRDLKEEITSVRKEVSTIRVEMHDINGRLGRVESLLMAPDAGGS